MASKADEAFDEWIAACRARNGAMVDWEIAVAVRAVRREVAKAAVEARLRAHAAVKVAEQVCEEAGRVLRRAEQAREAIQREEREALAWQARQEAYAARDAREAAERAAKAKEEGNDDGAAS